jgi:hypothetical protein
MIFIMYAFYFVMLSHSIWIRFLLFLFPKISLEDLNEGTASESASLQFPISIFVIKMNLKEARHPVSCFFALRIHRRRLLRL